MELRIREQGAITAPNSEERIGNYAYYEGQILVENMATGQQATHLEFIKAIVLVFPDVEVIHGMEGELVWARE